ncbi:hypothetical protein CASFOL_025100 [Castilleja foliolosa]|uniref:Uncharacterized protein n=1 Tax=Castilleja foliolosa TaxID=1961234 RepID=A0ABD3CS18_9LAMI
MSTLNHIKSLEREELTILKSTQHFPAVSGRNLVARSPNRQLINSAEQSRCSLR